MLHMSFSVAQDLSVPLERDFERAVLPYLSIVFPDICIPKARGYWDQRGVDLMTSPEADPIEVCVQCKTTVESEFSPATHPALLKEIDKFIAGGVQCRRYILVLNRIDKHLVIAKAVRSHVAGRCPGTSFEVWDRQRVDREARASMVRRIRARVAAFNAEWQSRVADRVVPSGDWVKRVPACTYRLMFDRDEEPELRDPYELPDVNTVELLLDERGPRMNVLVGHFGAGKTSAALLATRNTDRTVIYVPASAFRSEARNGSNGLTKEIGRALGVRPEHGEPGKIFLWYLGRGLTRILRNERDVVLIIDGLDENRFTRGLDGLKLIRTQLVETLCRVILSTRTTHFALQGGDLAHTFLDKGRIGRPGRGMRVIELRPWTIDTAHRHVDAVARLMEPKEAIRIRELSRLMGSGGAHRHYGTLLTHPIFLDLIIDDVAQEGVRTTSRAGLIRSWMVRKIRRDQRKYDGAPLGGDLLEEVRLIFGALEDVALAMMDSATATPSETITYTEVQTLLAKRGLNADQVLEVLLKSVLITLGQRTTLNDAQILFSHRIFHEYLIASGLRRTGQRPPHDCPQEIADLYLELDAAPAATGNSALGGRP